MAESRVTNDDVKNAEIIWEYMKCNHKIIQKHDVILCLGSYDLRVAEKAASLWLQELGDVIVFSGNTGKLTEGLFDKPEAEVFADRAAEMGVPRDRMYIENKSTNTGENIRFSYVLMQHQNLSPTSILMVQKPYMERRAFATFMKQWPDDPHKMAVSVTSPEVRLVEYPNEATGDLSEVISVMLGDMARIELYETKGFQIHQDIPDDVIRAYRKLIETGKYVSHMPT